MNVGTQLGEQAGWAGVLALLATVNIFLGLINLAPILPFDGGHIAVVRSFDDAYNVLTMEGL